MDRDVQKIAGFSSRSFARISVVESIDLSVLSVNFAVEVGETSFQLEEEIVMSIFRMWMCLVGAVLLSCFPSCTKSDAPTNGPTAAIPDGQTAAIPNGPTAAIPDLSEPASPLGNLTADDYVLLESAMQKYYHNGQLVSPQPVERNAAILLKHASGSDVARSVLAIHAFVVDRCMQQLAKNQKSKSEFFKKLPEEIQLSAFRLAVEQFPSGYDVDLDALERATSNIVSTIDQARLEQVWEYESEVLIWQRFETAAIVAELLYSSKLGSTDLASSEPLKAVTYVHDPVSFRHEGIPHRLEGRFLKLEHRGKQELTNVLIVSTLKSTGATSQLNANQQGVDLFNRYFGTIVNSEAAYERYMDAVEASRKIQLAYNYYQSMPKTGFVFVRQLNPGDTLAVPLGALEPEYVTDGQFAVYSDQGYWPVKQLKIFRDSNEVDMSLSVGASEEHVRDHNDTLRPIKLSEWPKPPAPDLSNLPSDTQFFTTSSVEYPLPCEIYGFSNNKLVYRTFLQKDYFAPHIAGEDVKLGMSEKDARALFLDKSSTNGSEIDDGEWPVPPRPSLSHLPSDTKYYEYGNHPHWFVVGYSEGKVVYAEYFQAPKRRGDPD